jgi:hypothetical protein
MQTKILFIAAFLLGALFLVGCTDNNADQSFQGRQFRNGNFSGNFTDEQRQQMMQDRMQAAASACEGKMEGDACETQSARGNAAGTCALVQENLACNIPRPSGGYGPSIQGS